MMTNYLDSVNASTGEIERQPRTRSQRPSAQGN
jgi:hypothetical protein